MTTTPPIPITLLTGFLGSGKTTLLLSLLPQLAALSPSYKLAVLKNEFGDVAIDSQLTAAGSGGAIAEVREMLGGCICCNLVGELGVALEELRGRFESEKGCENGNGGLRRVVVETSGSAWPATLAMEVNRLGKTGRWVLDGVVSVIDVENWKGYEDTSYTAKLQARYTDLIVFNKWEGVSEARFDECLDRLGDLEGVQVAWVKSDRGKVPIDLVFGIDESLARGFTGEDVDSSEHEHSHSHTNGHTHERKGHQSEVEILCITLKSENGPAGAGVNTETMEKLLKEAPKDEVYRIKAVFTASKQIAGSDEEMTAMKAPEKSSRYILNWAFGRWTCTPMTSTEEDASSSGAVLRMTMILARYESKKWKKNLETKGYIALGGGQEGVLDVQKIG